jgi:hypothetical protein
MRKATSRPLRLLRLISALVLLLWFSTWLGMRLAAAQATPTPAITSTPSVTNTPVTRQPPATPTLRVTGAPFIVGTYVEPLFPNHVVLQVRLNLPLERVRSARVRLYQADSGLDFTAEAELNNPDLAQERPEFTALTYVWRIDPSQAPRLFSYINMDWTVSLRENVTATVLSGFVFQDVRPLQLRGKIAAWRSSGADGSALQLYSHNELLSLGTISAQVLRVLDKATRQTGLRAQYKFIIYDPDMRFCDGALGPDGLYLQAQTTTAFYPCRVEDAIAIYVAQGYQVIERATPRLDLLQRQIEDFILRDLHRRLWRVAQPPAWFREGLFQLYQPSGQARALSLAREASRANALLPLAALERDLDDLSQIEMWRAQSYLMVAYLASRYGAEMPFDLAASLSDVYSFDAALAALLNTDAATLYNDWAQWLFTDAAEAAVNWTPYLGVTPTHTVTPLPTGSRTPTKVIPTLTPRPTFTAPPILSFTPVPPTATNTARPAGSLRSPTPRPTPAPDGPLTTLGRSPLLLLLVAAVIMVVVALVLGGVLRRRR